ncbi:nucleoside 2-deoxyribosyltransferase [Edwardsiella phage vB_EpM_ZHS]|nr:nucleoside 2-deoxyribosyltransferase [Edwardsiella phage vB_EpM_ZHS]
MKINKLYLCGPIHGLSDAECNNWRQYVTRNWGEHAVLDPMRRDARGRMNQPGIATEIVEADKADILEASALLVYYAMPSVGTSMEILFAWEQHKPIVVVNASLQPKHELSLWLQYHATIIVDGLDPALRYLESAYN